jgi:RNA polymerase sigma-70 factor, ECF subfamily
MSGGNFGLGISDFGSRIVCGNRLQSEIQNPKSKIDMARTPGDSSNDVSLMQRIASRDGEALRCLFDRYGRVCLGICVRILRDRNEAEQLLIDVFAEVWERCDRYDASRGSPITYLITLSRSRAIDRVRARKASPASSLDSIPNSNIESDNTATPLDQTLIGERRTMVREALRRLDPNQRQAVELAFYDGLSHSEIADKLNKPLGTVKTHIRQGLIRLRDTLRNQWEGAGSTS